MGVWECVCGEGGEEGGGGGDGGGGKLEKKTRNERKDLD